MSCAPKCRRRIDRPRSSDPPLTDTRPTPHRPVTRPPSRRPRWVAVATIIAGWAVPVAISTSVGYFDRAPGAPPPPFWRVALTAGVGWYYWALAALIVTRLAHRRPIRRPVAAGTLALYAGLGILLILVHAAADLAAVRTWTPWLAAPSVMVDYREEVIGWFPLDAVLYASILAITHWTDATRRERERELQAAALSTQLAQAQLGALRMQMHPHFLFNALNTITVLAREHDTETVVELLTRLGNVLRQVMRADRSQELPLRDELAMLRDYIAIEEVRFADRLDVRWTVADETLDAAVPSLVLQPLVENAFRHGIAVKPGACTLEIGAERRGDALRLWVRNDGPHLRREAPAVAGSPGLGLSNTRARLACLHGSAAALEVTDAPGGVLAVVTLPFRSIASSQAGWGSTDRATLAR